jgi:hypothetical protein
VQKTTGDLVRTTAKTGGDLVQSTTTAAGEITHVVQRASGDVLTSTQRLGGDLTNEARYAGGQLVTMTREQSGDVVIAATNAAGQAIKVTEHATGEVIRTVETTGVDVVETSKRAGGDIATNLKKSSGDVVTVVEKANGDIVTTVKKAAGDTATTIVKAEADTRAEVGRALVNTADAAKALERFHEQQLKGTARTLTNAEQRLREGKAVDALWGLGTEPLQQTQDNAAAALQESTILATVAQTAAAAYGGPAGAAAYAAWYAYKQTGDANLALRVGLITAASSYASAGVGGMPSGTAGELAKKTALAAAVGGLAAAAAGGDRQAMQEAALWSAGAILLQDGYKKYTGHELDGKSSQGEAYCMAADPASKATCLPPEEAYLRDANGKILTDADGLPQVDVTKTDPSRPHVGKWSPINESRISGERSGFMTGVSRVPGMNAMSVFHDNWAVSWDMGPVTTVATIPPAIVLTYIGTGAPYYDRIEKTAIERWREDQQKSAIAPAGNGPANPPAAAATGPSGGAASGKSGPKAPTAKAPTYEERGFLCQTAAQPRTVWVEKPLERADFACRVHYIKDGVQTTPWVARNEKGYCAPKAQLLADKLAKPFQCIYRGP